MTTPALVDHLGRPLRTPAVTKAQLQEAVARASLTGVRQAWNTSTIASGLTPERLASIMRASADGDGHDYLTLAEEMEERDWHYAAELGKRKLAVLGLDRVLEPGDDSDLAKEIAEAVRTDIINDEAFEDLCAGLVDALGKGYSVVEIGWDTGRRWRPVSYEHRDPRWFRFDRETGQTLRMLDDADPVNGVELPPYRFAIHFPKLKQGLPIRGGLARLAAWAFLFKFYSIKDWAAFAETYGQPLRIGKYGPNATPADVDVLYQAVAMIGTDCAAVIPEFMNIDFVQAMTAGSTDLYERWCDWLDRQTSKATVGQSGTADANSGSGYAQAVVLDGVREDLRDADARQLARTIRRDVIEHYVRFNYGPTAPIPLLNLQRPESEDLKALSDALAPLIDRGLTVKSSEIRSKFGLAAPEADDEVLRPAATGAPAPAPAADPIALNRRTFGSCGGPGCEGRAVNRTGGAADQVDLMTAEAVASWSEQMAPIIEPIQRLATAATSYEEFLAGLDDALIQGDATALAKALGAAMFKARALGDVRDDA
ncbi:DUF935 domain-containing protein [Brevundimonas faecalis]|uniref:DUF935 domain-containing protein n=1 Tax=Brevundimonas faecalis TaxID=947378 RepID=UPI0036113465